MVLWQTTFFSLLFLMAAVATSLPLRGSCVPFARVLTGNLHLLVPAVCCTLRPEMDASLAMRPLMLAQEHQRTRKDLGGIWIACLRQSVRKRLLSPVLQHILLLPGWRAGGTPIYFWQVRRAQCIEVHPKSRQSAWQEPEVIRGKISSMPYSPGGVADGT